MVAAAGIMAAFQPAKASLLTLNYDSPVLDVAPGGSVEVRATLTAAPGFVLDTDANGVQLPANPFVETSYAPYQQLLLSDLFGFSLHSAFVSKTPNPLGNLQLAGGASVDLDLGTLSVDSVLAPGSYTTDIGVKEDIQFLDCGVCITNANPFMPPSIDAGPLTIDVVAVPEPSTIALLGATLIAFGFIRRRAKS